MVSLARAYEGKRVFVTGHTGFKGSWLCEWLLNLGAEVWGYSLPPPTKPALFELLKLSGRIRHKVADIRNRTALGECLQKCRPHFIFHLAAQPIVRISYAVPDETWAINVFGTVNLLEALRELSEPCAAVIVTTDKVYANSLPKPHCEDDALGGDDPYSASKAAAEIVVASWRSSFFSRPDTAAVATARAGNVIGGGDWAADRLLPDFARALSAGKPIKIRNPASVRPWQHVLDPLYGYLLLGAELRLALARRSVARRAKLCSAFNFGPVPSDHRPVCDVVEEALKHWRGQWRRHAEFGPPPESAILRLDIAKAKQVLGWQPRWRFETAIERTVSWYQTVRPADAIDLTRRQIVEFSSDVRR
jgi:CDP-glucose 4,6-dehydratase